MNLFIEGLKLKNNTSEGIVRVLVVEDNDDIRDLIEMILTDQGYSVLTAEHGEEALKLIEYPNHVKVILLDMKMPIMNGWQFAEAYRKMTNSFKAPIIVCTAAQDAKKRADEISAEGYLEKPFKKKSLLESVKVFMKGYEKNL